MIARRIFRALDRAHERVGQILSVAEAWLFAAEAAADLRTCVGCGAIGTLLCDDCIDADLCACGSGEPHFVVKPVGRVVCPRDHQPPTGTRAC